MPRHPLPHLQSPLQLTELQLAASGLCKTLELWTQLRDVFWEITGPWKLATETCLFESIINNNSQDPHEISILKYPFSLYSLPERKIVSVSQSSFSRPSSNATFEILSWLSQTERLTHLPHHPQLFRPPPARPGLGPSLRGIWNSDKTYGVCPRSCCFYLCF